MKKILAELWKKNWFQPIIVFVFCTVLGIYFNTLDFLRQISIGGKLHPWSANLVGNLIAWYVRGLLFYPIRKYSKRLQAHAARPLFLLFQHLLLILAATVCHAGGVYLFRGLVYGFPVKFLGSASLTAFRNILIFGGPYNVLAYFVMVSFLYYFSYMNRIANARLVVLQGRQAEAQLQSLGNQLHPHFIFNVLNTISAYIPDEPNAAKRMLGLLAALMRHSLRTTTQPEIPLWRELALLDTYLQIEKLRFQDRLKVEFKVDEQAKRSLFPPMMLQTLVENSVRHGIADKISPGIISITAQALGKYLLVRVHDNGCGTRSGDVFRPASGIGISNTCARLEMLYGKNHSFRVCSREGSGFEVEIQIPLVCADLNRSLEEN